MKCYRIKGKRVIKTCNELCIYDDIKRMRILILQSTINSVQSFRHDVKKLGQVMTKGLGGVRATYDSFSTCKGREKLHEYWKHDL